MSASSDVQPPGGPLDGKATEGLRVDPRPESPAPAAVAAVVVSYGCTPALMDCLQALTDARSVRQVVVVDNKSDPAVVALADRLGAVAVTGHGNLGYARGSNLGARSVTVPWDVLAIVNPDVTVSDDFDRVAAEVVGTGAGIVSGRLATGTGTFAINWRRTTTPARELLVALFGTGMYARTAVPPPIRPTFVPQVDGALLLIPRAVWERLDGFDPRYELYYEDIDICRRAAMQGGVLLVPEVVGTHIGCESYERNRTAAYITLRVSRQRYLRKWHGLPGAAVALVATALELVTRACARTPEGAAARWRAFGCGWQELRRPGGCTVLGLSAADPATAAPSSEPVSTAHVP
jgi:N-acetylglucosaminyl-diphospho-decaprenol L-rhamnosyltransferase